MTFPLVQEDGVVREMTEQEYEASLASGWTPEETDSPIEGGQ